MPERPDQVPSGRRLAGVAAARGVALFSCSFTLLNLYGAWRAPGFSANIWWIDVGFLPDPLSGSLLIAAALLLLAWAVRPRLGVWRRRATLAALATLAVVALTNSVSFYRVWSDGEIDPQIPLPFSLVVLGVLVWLTLIVAREGAMNRRTDGGRVEVTVRMNAGEEATAEEVTAEDDGLSGVASQAAPLRTVHPSRLRAFLVGAAAFCACGLVFPLAQFWFFGHTDYRRPADVAVVLGAQVHHGGVPSTALNDRVTTGVDLYDEGLVDVLLMSGGTGESGYNEAEVMRDMAIAEGVPPSAIVVDAEGVNTQATVDDTAAIFAQRDFARILVVSHFYHLPRIKLTYARAGYDVLTVPAKKTGEVPQTPSIVAREVAGFWVYYLRAVLR